jgi:hypothetical protein
MAHVQQPGRPRRDYCARGLPAFTGQARQRVLRRLPNGLVLRIPHAARVVSRRDRVLAPELAVAPLHEELAPVVALQGRIRRLDRGLLRRVYRPRPLPPARFSAQVPSGRGDTIRLCFPIVESSDLG